MKSIGILKPPPLPAIKHCVDKSFLKPDKSMDIGEIYSVEVPRDASSKLLSNFFQALTDNGYTKRSDSPYGSLSFVYCKGSIEPHCDEGYGLVALWLVSVKRFHRTQSGYQYGGYGDPSFYSSRQWMDVRLGEIIVFDANKEHAWLSNYHCSMILQIVRKTRRTCRIESN